MKISPVRRRQSLMNKRSQSTIIDPVDQEQLNQIKINQFRVALNLFQLTKTIGAEYFNEILPAMKNIEFFKQSCPQTMSLDDFIKTCVHSLSYEMIPKTEAVFHWGDNGDKFYIIMDGICAVYVQRGVDQIQQEILKREQLWDELILRQQDQTPFSEIQVMKDNAMFTLLQQKTVNPELIRSEDLLLKLNKKIYFNKSGICLFQDVANLSQGQYFGEMALANNQPRAASIIAKSDLHVLVLKKPDFRVIFEQQIQDSDDRLNFFMDKFHIGRYNISLISQYFSERTIMPNLYLWRENEPLQGFFLIKSGWIQLEVQIEEIEKKKLDQPKNIINYSQKQRMIICTQTTGSFVGEQDVINNVPKYPNSCIVLEKTIYYWISCESFKIMRTMFPEVIESLKPKVVNSKLQRRQTLQIHQLELQEAVLKEKKQNVDRKEVRDLELQIKEESALTDQKDKRFENDYNDKDKTQIRSHYKRRQSYHEIVDFNEKQQKEKQKVLAKQSPEKNNLDCVHVLYPNFKKMVEIQVSKMFYKQTKKEPVPIQNISIQQRRRSQEDAMTFLSNHESILNSSNLQDLTDLPQPSIYKKNPLIQNKIRISQSYLLQKREVTLQKYQNSNIETLNSFHTPKNVSISSIHHLSPIKQSQRMSAKSINNISLSVDQSQILKLKNTQHPQQRSQINNQLSQKNLANPQWSISPSKLLQIITSTIRN